MKRERLHRRGWRTLFFPILALLLCSCGDEEYYYPSVKLEFVTVEAGDDGAIRTLVPDKGEVLPVSEDKTASVITPNTTRRVLSNYETLSGTGTAVIYSLQSLATPMPKPVDDPAYKDGVKTDPVEMVSIWMGRDYLNMILNFKIGAGGKGHVLGMVEDVTDLQTDGAVGLLLYHDANSDAEYYNRRAYVSVPLSQYVDEGNPGRTIKIKFKYYTYDTGDDEMESDELGVYGIYEFDYTPE